MKLAAALFTCLSSVTLGQTPEVPHKMQFAGMTLTIRDDARREIQKDVDMLTQSPKHLNIKVERAKTYFPIIEKIFEENACRMISNISYCRKVHSSVMQFRFPMR
jgi:membrane-bound lytic murein transglycosylase D